MDAADQSSARARRCLWKSDRLTSAREHVNLTGRARLADWQKSTSNNKLSTGD